MLGGAISNLALVDFAALYPMLIPRIWGVSFGSPRVGNLDYADFLARQPYADRLIRIANSGDPVVSLVNCIHVSFSNDWKTDSLAS